MHSESGSPSSDGLDWSTDDELEMEFLDAAYDGGTSYGCDSPVYCLEAASSSESSSFVPSKVDHFVSMGFDKKMVIQALKENGEANIDAILDTLLTSSTDDLPTDALSDADSANGDAQERHLADKDCTIAILVDMGYQLQAVLTAIEKCGSGAPIHELVDYVCAAEMDSPDGARKSNYLDERNKKRKFLGYQQVKKVKKVMDDDSLHLPNPMIGFGAPGFPSQRSYRSIPLKAAGPPFFYFENVALTPKGVWQEISQSLYGIEPEFVDSIHFSAAARKRGYVHNLPIEDRKPLLPIPPKTIHEALPFTRKWWPSWDKRTKLNCLLTCPGHAQLTNRIRKRIESGRPSDADKKYVIQECKKWNLVWVGRNKAAVLEPEDMETLLGFPRDHTRGVSRLDRYKSLGNSFQIDTVAYHLSVLKPKYPNGINVLSLFSGIGGAEVALHRLGITLKNVVSVEKSTANQQILQDWWGQTEQKGTLIHVDDVLKVDRPLIEHWIHEFGGFDLVIGGSPCNNFAGANRWTRDGLVGAQSSLFYEYFRILQHVISLTRKRRGFPESE